MYFLKKKAVWLAATMLLTAMTITAKVADYPYTASYGKYTSDGWQGKASNSNQWKISLDYSAAQPVRIELNKSRTSRCRLFSPQLSMKAGYRYTITFEAGALVNPMSMEITPYLSDEVLASVISTMESNGNIKLTGETLSSTNSTHKTGTLTYDPEEDTELYFMLDITSDNTAARTMAFYGFEVTETQLIKKPLPVGNLEVKAVDNNTRDITLSWLNPDKYLNDLDLTIGALKVKRGEELLATLTDASFLTPCAEVTYTDRPDKSGEYVYSIIVVDPDGVESDPVSVTTPFVGKPDALTVPHTFDFTNATTNAFWSIVTADAANGWTFSGNYLTCARDGYRPSSSTATTPDITLEAGKAYKVSYNVKESNVSNKFSYQLTLIGNDADAVVLIDDDCSDLVSNKDMLREITFSVPVDGLYNLGLVADLEKLASTYYNNTLSISSLSIEEVPVVPLTATELSVLAAADGSLTASLTWLNPDKTETGLPTGAQTATVYRDGAEVATVDAQPGATSTFTDNAESGLTAGYHTYHVVIDNANGHTDATPESVRSSYVGSGMSLPYVADFTADVNLYDIFEYTAKPADGKVFTLTNGRYVLKTKATESSDALMMPKVAMQSGHIYRVSVETAISSSYGYELAYSLILVPATDLTDYSAVIGESTFNSKQCVTTFSVDESGDYFVLLLTTPAATAYSEYEYYVNALSIEECPVTPAIPADAEAKVNVNDNKIVLSWTMPETSPEGVTLRDNVTATIYKGETLDEDAEPLTVVEAMPGTPCSYDDADPDKGLNSYMMVLSYGGHDDIAGGETEMFTVVSGYFDQPVSFPYNSDFKTEDGLAAWTIINETANSDVMFTPDEEGYLNVSATAYNHGINHWIVSPMMVLEEGVTYTLTFVAKFNSTSSSTSSYYIPNYTLYIGEQPMVDEMKKGKKIANALTMTKEYAVYTHKFYLPDYELEEPYGARRAEGDTEPAEGEKEPATGNHYMGMHFNLNSYYYNPEVSVKSISLTSDKAVSGVVNVAATAETSPCLIVDGRLTAADNASIMLYTPEGKMVAAAKGELDMTALPAGLYIITVIDNNKTLTLKHIIR